MFHTAEVIDQHRAEILEAWMQRARNAASSRGLELPQLTNLVPAYLATLGRSARDEAPTAEQRRLIESHLSHRLRQGFDLNEVIVEFSTLARAIGEAIEGLPAEERPPPHEVAVLFQELHFATVLVSKIYSEHLLEDEQLEKRYARLIQDVVTEAIHSGNGGLPVRDRLAEIVALVQEALGATAAALLLYDPQSERLISTASSGLDDESLETYVAAVTQSSFVGKVATESTGTLVIDTSTTPLELSDAVRRAGIRSLLGVRLSAGQSLFGVLFVGGSGEREFTPSDVRRLESLGDRITLHLDNAQLSTRLREKLAQVELFVDILAHDLRGPLTAALLQAGMLRDGTADQGESVAKLERSIDRANRMIADLLDVHRMVSGEPLQIDVADANADDVLADAVDELAAQDASRVVVRAEGHPTGAFDAALVRRALWNLIVNALKYGDASGAVTVSLSGDDTGFVVEVHNEGAPITPEVQRTLFKPFARARTATKTSGWGLGLALVAGCASAHGGSVTVRSEADAGTTFRLSIPWQCVPDHAAKHHQHATDARHISS